MVDGKGQQQRETEENNPCPAIAIQKGHMTNYKYLSCVDLLRNICSVVASVDMDGGEKAHQLTDQLHEANMQLAQMKERNVQLETQHHTATEEVKNRIVSISGIIGP